MSAGRVASALGAVVVGLLLVLAPTAAWAHASLVSSDPSGGEVLDALPDVVTLTFSDDLSDLAEVIVTGPDGADVATGDAEVSGAVLTQAVADAGRGGYALAYRATSADGHPLTGRIDFSVGQGPDTEPAPSTAPTAEPAVSQPPTEVATASSPASDGVPVHDIAVPLTLISLGAAAWLLSRRRVADG